MKKPIKILGLALYGDLAASNRVRLGQYKSELNKYEIILQIEPLLDNDYLKNMFDGGRISIYKIVISYFKRIITLLKILDYDLVIIHCELFPFFPAFMEKLFLRKPYIYDFDDAWFLRYQNSRYSLVNSILGKKFENNIKNAAAVIAGNSNLAGYAVKFNPNIYVLPSVVDTRIYKVDNMNKNDIFTVGWIGSPSSTIYIKQIVEPLERLANLMPVRFVAIGAGKIPTMKRVNVIQKPWDDSTEIIEINKFDIGVMPLDDNEWTHGKCGYKLIQYMACGLPVVASKVGANVDIISSDIGFLVDDAEGWINAFRVLGQNQELRMKMGKASRLRVESRFSLINNVTNMVKIINQIADTSNLK
jgi:glycosyltransferase involved in cell wall biosynthesis